MSAELKLLAVNAVFLGYAYIWVYPRLSELSVVKIVWRDVVISLAALCVGGLLYFDSGVWFDLIVFEANWLIFQVITFTIMETPLFLWFIWKCNLTS